MNKAKIMPLIIIFILIILLLIPDKKEMFLSRVYDPNVNYQVFKQINSVDDTYANVSVVYNEKTSKMDFIYYPNSEIGSRFLKDIQGIMYLETYVAPYSQPDHSNPDEYYFQRIGVIKDGKYWVFMGNLHSYDRTEEEYLEYISIIEELVKHDIKVEPFIPKTHTPKEFYERYKEYFFPYYLADYEVKK